jgi:hypothetical protein
LKPDDRLNLLTHLAVWPLVGLSAVFGPMLFFLPDLTDQFWSWPIQPPMSAVVLGAGYLLGMVAFGTLLIRNRWHAFNVAIPTTWVFAIVMLAATLIHLERFFVGTMRFNVWFVIYVVLPILLPVIWLLNRRRGAPRRPDDLVFIWPVRIALLAGGVLVITFGLFMFVYPPGAAAVWPWLLTPLMSRMLSGWVLFLGMAGCLVFFEPRYSAYRFTLPGIVIWGLTLLAGSLLHLDDFNFQRLSPWLWFLAVLGLIVGTVLAIGVYEVIGWRRRRAGVQLNAPTGVVAGAPPGD